MPTARKRKMEDVSLPEVVQTVSSTKQPRTRKLLSVVSKDSELLDTKTSSTTTKASEAVVSKPSSLKNKQKSTGKKGLKAADEEEKKATSNLKDVKTKEKKTVVNKSTDKKNRATKTPVVSSSLTSDKVKKLNPNRITSEDYDKSCEDLAKFFLGKLLVSEVIGGCRVSGRIVETEAYLGGEDKASDSYGGRKTKRNEAMFMCPGMASIYSVYGMYTCINISSRGDGAAVLIRSLEPVEGLDSMRTARRSAMKSSDAADKMKEHELCNGPAKFMKALGITKDLGGNVDLSTCTYLWIENDAKLDESQIVSCARVGIERAGTEWANKPLRFYVRDNKCVSKRDKKAED